ncbi:hypothetical protein HELRODRAFT_185184 [Helobdella robusta]|uniref:Protein Wnt n=1 Tax=Helobdella robusta TaxID=6412 RepID=T1FMH4_HELRO|nr:hypothetical protein HELRODRAFT_185184 [Helobdella robusta]ESN91555.1 hypothetical protein HELRODRAFT_185184 [Helobdella robusta]
MCQKNLDLMTSVVQAAKQTIDVCQEIFFEKRWNCSTILNAPKFLPDLTGGSREQAFVYSLAAGSLAQTIAKACSSGLTSKCGCAQIPTEPAPGNFRWGGCGDDVKFGVAFSRQFTDQTESRRKKRSKDVLMNVHNAHVGRKMLADSIAPICKCHGVSGSCSVKTCFKSLPALKVVAVMLQNRYSAAVEMGDNAAGISALQTTGSKKSSRSLSKRVASTDRLVFSSISPDYCLPDPSLGSVGTQGRECDKDSTGSSGCRSMCCGRGYVSEIVVQTFKCNCKYYWCCEVKCKVCRKLVEVHKCR